MFLSGRIIHRFVFFIFSHKYIVHCGQRSMALLVPIRDHVFVNWRGNDLADDPRWVWWFRSSLNTFHKILDKSLNPFRHTHTHSHKHIHTHTHTHNTYTWPSCYLSASQGKNYGSQKIGKYLWPSDCPIDRATFRAAGQIQKLLCKTL